MAITHDAGPWTYRHGRIYGQPDPRSKHPSGCVLIGGVADDDSGWEAPFGASIEQTERANLRAVAVANGRLMAAAPDLLDVIERTIEHFTDGLPDHLVAEMREAVAKATGGAS